MIFLFFFKRFHSNLNAGTGKQLYSHSFPCVVKVSSTHAGFGKTRVQSKAEFDDLMSILALTNEYFTVEPFIDNIEYEFRCQQIGTHRRAFRRNSDSSWKNNWGNLTFVDHAWQEKYDVWMDECVTIAGGLDLFAIDVLHLKNGNDVILEMNDTAVSQD